MDAEYIEFKECLKRIGAKARKECIWYVPLVVEVSRRHGRYYQSLDVLADVLEEIGITDLRKLTHLSDKTCIKLYDSYARLITAEVH